ncbi:MAG: glutathione S-transferase C-terminal domain-containing protein [Hydrogenophaga sp.]
MVGFGACSDALDALERGLSSGPYVCGERFTAADVNVGSSVVWGPQFGTIEKRPVFEDYAARVVDRPAHVRASHINEARLTAQP